MKTLSNSQMIDCLQYIMRESRYAEARDLCEYILQRLQINDHSYYEARLMMLEIYLNLHDQENFIEAYTLYKEEIMSNGKPEDCVRLALFGGHYHTYMTKNLDHALCYYRKTASLAFQHRFPRMLSMAITGMALIMHEQQAPYPRILKLLKYNLANIQEMRNDDPLAYMDAHLIYCRTLICLKQYNEAKAKIRELLILKVPPFIRLKLQLQLASAEYEEGEYEKAIATCEDILRILGENPKLGEILYIYHEIYALMLKAADALNSPAYDMYKQSYREIREKQEMNLQLKMASMPIFHASLPNYEPNKSFFRKINRTCGTFFVLKTADIQSVLSTIGKHSPFIWTTFINTYGFYLYAELTEEELAALLTPFVEQKYYACCRFLPDTITPKECSCQMQALLYHQEMTASETLYM
jgi:tetratricopeptide (TPR) repeat protein